MVFRIAPALVTSGTRRRASGIYPQISATCILQPAVCLQNVIACRADTGHTLFAGHACKASWSHPQEAGTRQARVAVLRGKLQPIPVGYLLPTWHPLAWEMKSTV